MSSASAGESLPSRTSSATPGAGGHFRALKQKLQSGCSPSPALATHHPAPTPATQPSVGQIPLINHGSVQTNDDAEIAGEHLVFGGSPQHQRESRHVSAETESPLASEMGLTLDKALELDVDTELFAGASTGNGDVASKSTRLGARTISGTNLAKRSVPKTKLKLAVSAPLVNELGVSAADAHHHNNQHHGVSKPARTKSALPVGKALRVERTRVGVNQAVLPDLAAQREQKKAEDAARQMLEQDILAMQKGESRIRGREGVKKFFTEGIPGLFTRSTVERTDAREQMDEKDS